MIDLKPHWNLSYPSQNGLFFIISRGGSCSCFYQCRVEFAWRFRKHHNLIGFFCKEGDVNKVKSFFDIVETKLNLKNKTLIQEVKNQNGKVIVFKLNPFWLKNSTNRSLVTLLIRCAAIYHYNDFDKAINAYYLTKICKKAINLFLNGYNKPTYDKMRKLDEEGYTGFVAQFENLDNSEIKKLLTK